MTYEDTTSATSSPASVDGAARCDWPAGATLDLFGPALAPASRSAPPAEGLAKQTSATSGLSSDASSRSAALQRSLENRLRAALDVTGSPEYVLTWKHWAMESGPPICALRASARRTSDSVCGGWPTARQTDGSKSVRTDQGALNEVARKGGPQDLDCAAHLAGWPTPTKGNADGSQMARDASTTGRRPDGSKATVSLNQVAQQAGWPTPTRQDSASSGAAGYSTESGRHAGTTLTDAARFAGPGATTPGSPALTEKRGALASTLSRWLMGYPIFWQQCSPTTLPKRRKR